MKLLKIDFDKKLRFVSKPNLVGVYSIHINNKVYIGSSKNILNRLSNHRSKLRNGSHRYSNDFGEFKEHESYFKIYLTEEYIETEKHLITKYKSLGLALNYQIGNTPKHTSVTKEKISKSLKGKVPSLKSLEAARKGRMKVVLDTNTGVFYESSKNLTDLLGINNSTFRGKLCGKRRNETQYKYV